MGGSRRERLAPRDFRISPSACSDGGRRPASPRLAVIEWPFPACVQGFVKKRSTTSNATIHLGQPRLLHADIRDFFGSIAESRVVDAFRALGARAEIAAALGAICTLNGRLPQGSSSSPIVANLVCRHLDADFEVLANASECRYSRYADDITISGRSLPPSVDVAAALHGHGFELRDGQCRLQYRGRAQYVTGLTIADPVCPRLPKAAKKRLRLQLHYAERFGLEDHLSHVDSEEPPEWALNRLGGWITYMYSVEGERTKGLAARFNRVREVFEGSPQGSGDQDPAVSGEG